MAGYGGREKPSEGVLSDLYAKAMAIEGVGSPPAILITADLVNFRAPTAEEICRRIGQKTGVPRERIVLVPSFLHVLLDSVPDLSRRVPTLTLWISSGETLTPSLARRFAQRVRASAHPISRASLG